MITVTVRRSYYDATHFSTDEKGVLRVYRSDEVVAEYAAGEDVTVSHAPDPFQFSPKMIGADLSIPAGASITGS